MMQFKHLITHYLWARSFTHSEVARLLDCSEQEIMNFEDGQIPLPSQAYCIQKTLSYPKIEFWETYFRSVCLNHGMDMELSVTHYEEHLQMILTSKSYRHILDPKRSSPADECFLGIEMDTHPVFFGPQERLLPQNLATVLSTQMRLDDVSHDYLPEDIQVLADKYEVSSKSISRLLNDAKMPSEDELERLISRSNPGYERDRMMKGYFSSIIQNLKLDIVIEDKPTQALINQLEMQAKNKVFRKKRS